jgi:hypothetical protein
VNSYQPGQTLAPVFCYRFDKDHDFSIFFVSHAAPPIRHLKNVETGMQRMEVFLKSRVTFLSFRFASILPFSQVVAASVVPLQLILNMKSI